jgi:hypothetical protein
LTWLGSTWRSLVSHEVSQDFGSGSHAQPLCSCSAPNASAGTSAGTSDGCGGSCVPCVESSAPRCVDEPTTGYTSSACTGSTNACTCADHARLASSGLPGCTDGTVRSACRLTCNSCVNYTGTCPGANGQIPPSTAPPPASSGGGGGDGDGDGGAVAGVVIGVLAGVGLAAGAVFYYVRGRRARTADGRGLSAATPSKGVPPSTATTSTSTSTTKATFSSMPFRRLIGSGSGPAAPPPAAAPAAAEENPLGALAASVGGWWNSLWEPPSQNEPRNEQKEAGGKPGTAVRV